MGEERFLLPSPKRLGRSAAENRDWHKLISRPGRAII
jgi:hypothetical protein